MPRTFQDRYGMTLSTSDATAAEHWQEGLDRLLSQNHGPDAAFTAALACDDSLAFWYMQEGSPIV